MIVLNSLFPIFVLLLFGQFLRRRGLTDTSFLKTADRLIYYFFFPIMLFWKIGGAAFAEGIDWKFCFAVLAALVTIFLLSTLLLRLFAVTAFKSGSFSQGCYRFNTYIGVAVILNSLGAEGIQYYGLAISLAIPLVNLYSVSTLIWFSGEAIGPKGRLRIVVRALVSNPLILGCLAGIVYSQLVGSFPEFIDNSLSLTSMVALPLALLSIGGTLSFAGLRGNLGLALLAALVKLAALPLAGYLFLHLFQVEGIAFKVAMLFFALPASTAIYVLSSQLHSDTELASAIVVVSTVLSFLSLSLVLLL